MAQNKAMASKKWVRAAVISVVASVTMAGCSTVNPYTGESQTAKVLVVQSLVLLQVLQLVWLLQVKVTVVKVL